MKSKKYPIGTGGGRHPERIERKRSEANERAASWGALTRQAKLDSLDARLGVGVGAKKQRAALASAK